MKALPVVVALLLAAGMARAGAQSTLPPSPAVACLQLSGEGPATPEYPEQSLLRQEGGTIRVQLTFRAPDEAPDATLLDKEAGSNALRDAVRRHVRRLRVPCMTAGQAPVVLKQNYVFVPNDGRKVVPSGPVDAADARRTQLARCIKHGEGMAQPRFPDWAQHQRLQENILLQLRFTASDQPPTATVLAAPKEAQLVPEVMYFAKGLRMPCHDGGEPVLAQILFKYQMEGGERHMLKDSTLRTLIAASQSYPRPVYFDLRAMACPFDLRLTYNQPFSDNAVGEFDTSVPARQPLIDWLKRVVLAVPERQRNALLGQTMTVTVPCGTVDL